MQNFQNHTRYYPFHHFLITPLTLIYLGWSFSNLISAFNNGEDLSPVFYQFLGAFLLFLLPLLARIYALKNQDRIIRLEMRQRYFELTGKSFREWEKRLRMSQIVALRFASDQELVELVEKAAKKGMRSKEIKKSIENWQEDRHRV